MYKRSVVFCVFYVLKKCVIYFHKLKVKKIGIALKAIACVHYTIYFNNLLILIWRLLILQFLQRNFLTSNVTNSYTPKFYSCTGLFSELFDATVTQEESLHKFK